MVVERYRNGVGQHGRSEAASTCRSAKGHPETRGNESRSATQREQYEPLRNIPKQDAQRAPQGRASFNGSAWRRPKALAGVGGVPMPGDVVGGGAQFGGGRGVGRRPQREEPLADRHGSRVVDVMGRGVEEQRRCPRCRSHQCSPAWLLWQALRGRSERPLEATCRTPRLLVGFVSGVRQVCVGADGSLARMVRRSFCARP